MTKYELEQRKKQYKKYVITTNFINQEKNKNIPVMPFCDWIRFFDK